MEVTAIAKHSNASSSQQRCDLPAPLFSRNGFPTVSTTISSTRSSAMPESIYIMGYFDEFCPFIALLQAIKWMLSHQHFKSQDAHSPDIPSMPAINSLNILRRQIFKRTHNRLKLFLIDPIISFFLLFREMREPKITQFDGSLYTLRVTFAIMIFSSLTSACTMFFWCRYLSASRSCLST